MATRRSRFLPAGLAAALLAVLGTVLLCTWHCADFHDDVRPASTIAAAAPVADADHEPDGSPVHVAAHAACQGFVTSAPDDAVCAVRMAVRQWGPAPRRFVAGLPPLTLLRPPRA